MATALDRLNAHVTHETDEEAAEFARLVSARDAEVLRQAANTLETNARQEFRQGTAAYGEWHAAAAALRRMADEATAS